MAIEYFDGFENGLLTPPWTGINGANQFSLSAVGTGRNGGRAIQGGLAGNAALLNLPGTAKKTVGAAWFYADSILGATNTSTLQIRSDAGVTTHLSVNVDATGHLLLRRGTHTGTIIATSTAVCFTTGQWRYYEMQAVIDDVTGSCIVRYEGTEVINFTGDTRNAGTSTLIDGVSVVTSGSGNSYVDDVYTTNGTDATATTGRPDNGFLGDVKVELLLPNGNGASSQWVGSDGNSTDNYLLVDEHPPNTTDYVTTATDGQRDLWDLSSLSVAAATVLAVQPAFYCAKSDAGAASINPLIRESSGTVTVDPTLPLSTSYGYALGGMRTAKPGGGAWTVADVNGLQVGVEKTT